MAKRNDLLALCVIFIFCLSMFPAVKFFVEVTPGDEISPRFWPCLSLFVAIAGTLTAVYKSFKDGNRLNLGELLMVSGSSRKQFSFVVMSILYIKAMEYAGFIVASLVMLPVLMFFFGYRNKVYAPVISVVFIGALFFVFSKIFRISFPTWVLGV